MLRRHALLLSAGLALCPFGALAQADNRPSVAPAVEVMAQDDDGQAVADPGHPAYPTALGFNLVPGDPVPALQPGPRPAEPPPDPPAFLVTFPWDKAELTDVARAEIAAAAAQIRALGGPVRILAVGHTDRSGPADYNLALSARRADAARAELIRLGIRSRDVSVIARGEFEPAVPTPDGVRQSANRRTNIRVSFSHTPAWADLQAGWQAFVKRDYRTAAAFWRPLAERGEVHAQTYLGYLYENGQGMPRDDVQAARWYAMAAAKNQVTALNRLGVLYATGRGVPLDHGIAVGLFQRAEAQGYVAAQFNLGVMLESGDGLRRDLRQALSDLKQAIRWYETAARSGFTPAQTNLGNMYFFGHGVEQSYGRAMSWYRQAAERGDAIAQNNLGVMYSMGLGTAPDKVEALMWFEIAAPMGGGDRLVPTDLPPGAAVGVRRFYEQVSANRDALKRTMRPDELARARDATRGWLASVQRRTIGGPRS